LGRKEKSEQKSKMLFFFLLSALAHAQAVEVVVVASTLPTPLADNTNYVLSATISLSGAGDYVGQGNTTITCNTKPCFDVNLTTSGNVLFANVTFDLPSSGNLSSGTFPLFRVRNVGHLEVSNVSFRDTQTGSVELVQWRAAGGNLTIRGLGSAAAPVGFGSLLGAVTPAQVDALVFKDSHGACLSDCFTVTTVDGRVPQPSITFDNVHWRQNGPAAAQLIRRLGFLLNCC
jgi:hypothetical protein